MTGLAVLLSRLRSEEKALLTELDRRGVAYRQLDPRTLTFRCDTPDLPYQVVLCREIAHHRALYAARMFEHAGIPVVNTGHAIATCGDKLATTLALHVAGVSTVPAALALTPESGLAALAELGYPAVVKPLTGSWGHLVARLPDEETARVVLEHRAALPHPQQRITYLQRYLDKPGRDIRGLVVGQEVVGAVYRIAEHWRTNTARDARTQRCPMTDELAELLRAAAAAIGPGVYGIDVLEDGDGELYVNEINHTPEFHGALEVLQADFVGSYIGYALDRAGLR